MLREGGRLERGSGWAQPVARAADDIGAAVAAIWRHHARGEGPPRSSIGVITDLALSGDPEEAARGTTCLFRDIVEPLCDSFRPEDSGFYRRVFAQVIDAARSSPHCAAVHDALSAAGIRSERDLLAQRFPCGAPRPPPRTIIVLSRHTLGADVAINAPILRRMRRRYPGAHISFMGGAGAAALARCFPGVEHYPVAYARSDTLAARLNAWVPLSAAARQLAREAGGRCLVIDPDSRLTQLGLLPPLGTDSCRQFPARRYPSTDARPLSLLVEAWLDEVFGAGGRRDARLRLSAAEERRAAEMRAALRKNPRPIVSLSTGVGGNVAKAGSLAFEARLIDHLLRCGWQVMLARGTGDLERRRSAMLGDALVRCGWGVRHLPAGCLAPPAGANDVVTWEADVGAFLAAIRCADLYVGYDSAGQHIAAALGVPVLSIFIESAGSRHAERWAPRGPGPVSIVRAAPPVDEELLFRRACHALDRLAASMGSARR